MLIVENIQCQYDSDVIVNAVSFHVNNGDICCLLGPSGCGKTTILRAIAGFQDISQGKISLRDQLISRPHNILSPEQRNIGMVFQDYALFPHLNVYDNIRFGISEQSGKQQKSTVNRLLKLVQLGGSEKRFPHELSGGQQQRVALARALAPNPSLLLMDEPFSNLDTELRKRLSLEVRDILKELGMSAILVTHDQQEAFAFSDQIGLLYNGKLQQWDTPFNLYHEPQNRIVADFIGEGYFLPGTICSAPNIVDTELGKLVGNRAYPWPTGTQVDVLLRPDDITLTDTGNISATIEKKVFSGSATIYTLRLKSGNHIETLVPSYRDYAPGQEVNIAPTLEHLIMFPRVN
ncbi:MAG: ABC transporter ATP-binding protein [Spongiibacteraceae bacterium]